MPDYEGSDPPSRSTHRASEAAVHLEGSLPALDLAAALGGLDRATRNFTRRLGEAQGITERAAGPAPPAPETRGERASIRPLPPPSYSPRPSRRPSADDAFEARLHEAEREAREYLERAKQRADSLVATMVGAVEKEAAAIRRDAEEGIRARWYQVEADAKRHLEEARRVGDGMVAERQQRLSVLSDTITGRAEALSAGLEDAERVRVQFEAFVRALSATAERIAQQRAAGGGRVLAELRDLPRTPRPSAIAA